MKASDVLSPRSLSNATLPTRSVTSDTMVVDLLPLLLDTPDRRIGVTDSGELIGVVDETSILEGLGRFISPRDDSSIVVVDTTPSAYSASSLSHAVEDADIHLVDLWSSPGSDGNIQVTLRVRTTDPSPVVASLERHGYTVVDATGVDYRDSEVAMERLLSLKTMLNV